MPINANSTDPLYLAYRFAGPSAALIVPAALLNLVTISGVFMNSFVVLVTFLTKSLHGTANFLLAMISFFEVLHQSGHTIFLVIQVSGTNFVTFFDAVKMELIMLFGLNASLCGMASAAFDRLFAVVDQHRHRRLHKPIYLAIHVLICATFGLANTIYVYQYYSVEQTDSPTTGCIAEILSGYVGEIFFKITAIMNAICAFFYFLVWIVIRCKKGVLPPTYGFLEFADSSMIYSQNKWPMTKETNGRLLKSLVLILVVNIGGYFLNLGTYQILFHLPPNSMNPIIIWHFGFIVGILLNIGAASNALILYLNSTEYRKAFKRILNKTFSAIGIGSQIGSDRIFQINSTNQVNHPSVGGGFSTPKLSKTGQNLNPSTIQTK